MYFNAFHPLTLDNYCLCVLRPRKTAKLPTRFARERRTEFNYAKEKKKQNPKIFMSCVVVWSWHHDGPSSTSAKDTVYLVPAKLLLLCHTVDCCSVTMGAIQPHRVASLHLFVSHRHQRTRMAELRIYVLSIFFLVSFSIFVVDL